MASSKEMQLRAKIAKIAAKSEAIKHKLPISTFGGMQAIVMTPEVEAAKSLRICKSDRMPSCTYSNVDDVCNLTATKFRNNDAGWFFSLVTRHADGKIRVSKEGREKLVNDFRVVKFDDRYDLVSTYCSWDYAIQHYRGLLDTADFAVIGFSTPENLQTLAENPANY